MDYPTQDDTDVYIQQKISKWLKKQYQSDGSKNTFMPNIKQLLDDNWKTFTQQINNQVTQMNPMFQWNDCSKLSPREMSNFVSANPNIITVRYPAFTDDEEHFGCLWCEYLMQKTTHDTPIIDALEFLQTVFITTPFSEQYSLQMIPITTSSVGALKLIIEAPKCPSCIVKNCDIKCTTCGLEMCKECFAGDECTLCANDSLHMKQKTKLDARIHMALKTDGLAQTLGKSSDRSTTHDESDSDYEDLHETTDVMQARFMDIGEQDSDEEDNKNYHIINVLDPADADQVHESAQLLAELMQDHPLELQSEDNDATLPRTCEANLDSMMQSPPQLDNPSETSINDGKLQ